MHIRHPALALCLLTACPDDTVQDTAPNATSAPDATSNDPGNSEAGGDPTLTSTPTTTTSNPTANLDDSGAPDTDAGTTSTTSTTDAPDTTSTTTTDTTTGAPDLCGNGELDPGETCDDGDDDDTDTCLSDCTPGPVGAPLQLPGLAMHEALHCLTPAGDGLVLGGSLREPDDIVWAHVRQVPLPAGNPAAWSYQAKADPYGRMALEAATAADGDVVIGGLVYTEDVQVDSGGYLWLARFTAAGALVWTHDYPDIYVGPSDLEVAPSGDIVLVGHSWGFIAPVSTVAVFTADGQLTWKFYDDDDGLRINAYGGVAVADDGEIFVGGYCHDYDDAWQPTDNRVLALAFSPDGAPLWEFLSEPTDPLRTQASDIVLTSDDRLFLAATLIDDETWVEPTATLLTLDTAGNLLWSKEWAAPVSVQPATLVAADDGGVYLTAMTWLGDQPADTLLARFTADGDNVWTHSFSAGYPHDATLTNNLLHVLTSGQITVFTP